MGWISKWSASKGMVSVPNILEISKEAAEALIQSNGLTVGTASTVTQEDNTKTNTVITQAKTPGVLIDYETPIDFTYRIFSFTPFGVFSFAPVTPFSFTPITFSVFSFTPFTVFTFTPVTPTLSVSNVSGTATGTTTATISWTSSGQVSFLLMVVPRFTDNEPGFTLRGTTATSITATGLTPDNMHDITLFVYSGAGQTGSSELGQGTVKTNAPTQTVTDKTVPNVVGMTSSAAQAAITAAGLSTGSFATGTVTNSASNSGKVESQSPAAGTAVSSGTSVSLIMWYYVSSGCTVATTYTYGWGEWGSCNAGKQTRTANYREYSTTNADCSVSTGTQYFYVLNMSAPWTEQRDCLVTCPTGTTYVYNWAAWGECVGSTRRRYAQTRDVTITYADCTTSTYSEPFYQAGRSGPWEENEACTVQFTFTPFGVFSFVPFSVFTFTPQALPSCPGTQTSANAYTCAELGRVLLGGPDVYNMGAGKQCCGDLIDSFSVFTFTPFYVFGFSPFSVFTFTPTAPAFTFTPVFTFTPTAPTYPTLLSGFHLCAQGDVPNPASPCYQADVGVKCVDGGASGASCADPNAFSFTPTFSFAPTFSFTPTVAAFTFTPVAAAFTFTPTFSVFGFSPSRGPGYYSLGPKTKIRMADGSLKEAQDIVVGDELLSVNSGEISQTDATTVSLLTWSTNDDVIFENVTTTVNSVTRHTTEKTYRINGDAFSPNHVIMVKRNEETLFVWSRDVVSTDLIRDYLGNWVSITELEMLEFPVEVISINCEPYDIYFTEHALTHDGKQWYDISNTN
jgi:hypothetical protein